MTPNHLRTQNLPNIYLHIQSNSLNANLLKEPLVYSLHGTNYLWHSAPQRDTKAMHAVSDELIRLDLAQKDESHASIQTKRFTRILQKKSRSGIESFEKMRDAILWEGFGEDALLLLDSKRTLYLCWFNEFEYWECVVLLEQVRCKQLIAIELRRDQMGKEEEASHDRSAKVPRARFALLVPGGELRVYDSSTLVHTFNHVICAAVDVRQHVNDSSSSPSRTLCVANSDSTVEFYSIDDQPNTSAPLVHKTSSLLNAPYGEVCAIVHCPTQNAWFVTCMHPQRQSSILYKDTQLSISETENKVFIGESLRLAELETQEQVSINDSFLLCLRQGTERRVSADVVATMHIRLPNLLSAPDSENIAVSSRDALHNGSVYVHKLAKRAGEDENHEMVHDDNQEMNGYITIPSTPDSPQTILGLNFTQPKGELCILTAQRNKDQSTQGSPFFFASSTHWYEKLCIYLHDGAREEHSDTRRASSSAVSSGISREEFQRLERKVDDLGSKLDMILQILQNR